MKSQLRNKPTSWSAIAVVCIVALIAGELLLRVYFANGRLNAIEKRPERPIGDCVVFPGGQNLRSAFDAPGADQRRATRVFVFGESSIQGYPYTGNFNIPGWMSLYLRDLYPDKDITVVNCGSAGANSAEWGQLVFDAIDRYRPSLIVIYAGHNNFTGDKHIPSEINKKSAPARWIGNMYLVRLTAFTIAEMSKRSQARRARNNQAAPPPGIDELNNNIMDSFIRHIEVFASEAAKKNIPVVVSTVSSNRKDWPPLLSDIDKFCLKPASGSPHPACAAREFLIKGDYKAALPIFQKFKDPQTRIWPHSLMSYYEGVCLERLGDYKAALKSFNEALIYDPYRHRATPALASRILSMKNTPGIAAVVDADAEIIKNSKNGIPGGDMFVDHVHPSVAGQKIIAKALVKSIADNKLIEPATNWSRLRTDSEYDAMMSAPKNETDIMEASFCFRLMEQSMLSKSLECYQRLTPSRRRITEEAPVPILQLLLGRTSDARATFDAFIEKYASKKYSQSETAAAFDLMKKNLDHENLRYIEQLPQELRAFPAPDFKSFIERLSGIKLRD